MDAVKEGMREVIAIEVDIHDRRNRRRKTALATLSKIGVCRKMMMKKN